ncbi:hypothetical protein HGRIS_014264 [Hohenbuehelia grisea]|uniref:Uncharacterized protein n=1 Tax=Hohenbuehelia grisea TaxID=104357 RepID=A0ABR3JV20_9AGAR
MPEILLHSSTRSVDSTEPRSIGLPPAIISKIGGSALAPSMNVAMRAPCCLSGAIHRRELHSKQHLANYRTLTGILRNLQISFQDSAQYNPVHTQNPKPRCYVLEEDTEIAKRSDTKRAEA